jgi:hypothetical protein
MDLVFSFRLPSVMQPIHLCYPLCFSVVCPISWFLIVRIKARINYHLEKLAMVILFAQRLCPKLNATMHSQSWIQLKVVTCSNQRFGCHCLGEKKLNWRYWLTELSTQINSNVLEDKNILSMLYECNFIIEVYQMQVDIDEEHTQCK